MHARPFPRVFTTLLYTGWWMCVTRAHYGSEGLMKSTHNHDKLDPRLKSIHNV